MRRALATLSMLLAMLIGSVTAASAQTPIASPVAGGWQVSDVREISVDGEPIALSPDSRWIAGTGPDGMGVCVWDVASLGATCAATDVRPERHSFAWAPDSSMIAFTDGSLVDPEPNSLWLVSVPDVNVTARAGVAVSGSAADEGQFYGAPVWTADSKRVVFFQMPAEEENGPLSTEAWQATFASIDAEGGDAVPLSLPPAAYSARTVPTDGGQLLFLALEPGDLDGGPAGIWRARSDGTGLELVLSADDVPDVSLVELGALSPDQRTLVVWALAVPPDQDRAVPAPYVLDLTTGELAAVTPVDGSAVLWGDTPFSTDVSIAAVLAYRDEDDTVYLQTLDVGTGETHRVLDGALRRWDEYWFVSWGAGNRVLVATDAGATLLTLERT